MKQILFSLALLLPFVLSAQQKADTIVLKNGKVISGYIFKMEGGSISIAGKTDSATFTTDEVKSIMFCHEVRGKGPCSGGGTSSSSSAKGSSAGNRSYVNDSEAKNADKGFLQISCNQCGGRATLKIWAEFGNTKINETVQADIEKGKPRFNHSTWLQPGEYNWSYTDTNRNQSSGKVMIKKGERYSMVLFEK